MSKTFILTSSAGKRLIGKGMAAHPAIAAVLKKGTLVIIAGTTNGYVAEEILNAVNQTGGFSRKGFCRGATRPPGAKGEKSQFTGDVVLVDGKSQKGKTIFDVAGDLKAGDVVLKGANAVDVRRGRAAVLVGHPACGTAGATLPQVVGKREKKIVPIGLEKRVLEDVEDLDEQLNAPQATGPRLLPLPAEVFTELDAISLLTGATGRLVAAGGINGAEGCVWMAVTGEPKQLQAAEQLIQSVAAEPPCQV